MRLTTAIVIASISFAAWISWSTFLTKHSAQQIGELRTSIQRRSDENQRLDRDIGELRRKLRALNDRPEVKERLIREEVGLVHSDDVIFNFVPATH